MTQLYHVERRKPTGEILEHAPCETLDEALEWLRFSFRNAPLETSVKITTSDDGSEEVR